MLSVECHAMLKTGRTFWTSCNVKNQINILEVYFCW